MLKTRLVFIADCKDVSENLVHAIALAANFDCVAHYTTAEGAMSRLSQDNTDIYLVDLGLLGLTGLEFIKKAITYCPQMKFVVYTLSEQHLVDAVCAGAVGYILKVSRDQKIIKGLREVAQGDGVICPKMAKTLSLKLKNISLQRKTLTKTETNILQKLKLEITYAEIAAANHVARTTVQTHIRSFYRKLNVNNRVDAVNKDILFDLIE